MTGTDTCSAIVLVSSISYPAFVPSQSILVRRISPAPSSQAFIAHSTASGKNTARDSKAIRRAALTWKVPYCTTVAAARATATALAARRDETHVETLQEYYAREARGQE